MLPVFLYGAETGILKKEGKYRIDVFEMWVWEYPGWIDKQINESKRADEYYKLSVIRGNRIRQYVGQVVHRDRNNVSLKYN